MKPVRLGHGPKTIHPGGEYGLAIAWEPSERDFIGRKALWRLSARPWRSAENGVGLVMKERAVLGAAIRRSLSEGVGEKV